MKTFNKVITINVSVDTIANNLLNIIVDSFPHAELVVETIIGGSNNIQLGLLYNTLNGYTNEINFKVGDMIVPNIKAYGWWNDIDGPQSYEFIQEATIKEIDIYSKSKLLVEFTVPNKKGTNDTITQWVDHTKCALIKDISNLL